MTSLKRRSALLLLLLLPLTMAPRTSLDADALDVHFDTPRVAHVGAAFPVAVTFENPDETTKLMPVWLDFVNGDSGPAITVVTGACAAQGATVGCFVPSLEPGESVTYRLLVRPSSPGRLAVEVRTQDDGGSLGSPEGWQVVGR